MKRVVVLDGEAAFLTVAYLRMRLGRNALITYVGMDGQQVDVRVLRALKEDGVSVEGWQMPIVDLHMGEHFDVVITMSEQARKRIPLIPGTHRIHRPFPQAEQGTAAMELDEVYQLRNEVKFFTERLADELRLALAS